MSKVLRTTTSTDETLTVNIAISESSTRSRQLMRCSQNLSFLGESWSIEIVLFRSSTYIYPLCTTKFTKIIHVNGCNCVHAVGALMIMHMLYYHQEVYST